MSSRSGVDRACQELTFRSVADNGPLRPNPTERPGSNRWSASFAAVEVRGWGENRPGNGNGRTAYHFAYRTWPHSDAFARIGPHRRIQERGGRGLQQTTENKARTHFPASRRIAWHITPDRIRTCDLRFRKPSLYPLSYGGRKVDLVHCFKQFIEFS